jgi:hypothetical protein
MYQVGVHELPTSTPKPSDQVIITADKCDGAGRCLYTDSLSVPRPRAGIARCRGSPS